MNSQQLRRLRCDAQLLYRRERLAPEAVVEHMLAVQAQDRRGGRLALRARSSGLTAADVERALGEDRSIVISWLMRGTIHLATPEDYPWLLALSGPTQTTANSRRLQQEGISPAQADKGVALIDRWLREDGPVARPALRDRLVQAGLPAGQGITHLLIRATYEGKAVVGPAERGQAVLVSPADWLGDDVAARLGSIDRDVSVAQLARRFLRSRGPAAAVDLAYWAGLPLRDVRRGLELIASELVDVGDGLVDLASRVPKRLGPVPPRLLHTWDDMMLSWKDRSGVLPEVHVAAIMPGGGMFTPSVLVDGVVAGRWSPSNAKRAEAEVELFEPVSEKVLNAIERERKDIGRFETT